MRHEACLVTAQAGEVIHDHDQALGYVLTHDPLALPAFDDLPPEQRSPVSFTQAELAFNHGWLVQVQRLKSISSRRTDAYEFEAGTKWNR